MPATPAPQVAVETNAPTNTVYASSNAANGNTVLVLKRSEQGDLTLAGEYATGGQGTGSGLGNQEALATDGKFVVVVNAGSNDISVLEITPTALQLIDRMPSGGIRPVSVALNRDLVYVLNAGSDNIAGFRLNRSGRLAALDGSLHALSSGALPAQIAFAAEGTALIVTERATSMIVAFTLNENGVPAMRRALRSSTATPYGFVVAGRQIIVSEENGGSSAASATSSYRIEPSGDLSVTTGSVASMQTAACWAAITPDHRFVYVTNTSSRTISLYRLGADGGLSLIDPIAGFAPRPIDADVSHDGKFLHVLNAGSGTITTFRIEGNGALIEIQTTGAGPSSTTGLVSF